MSFEGKVVLITGVDSGIGAATAIHLAQLGAYLSISGPNQQNLDKIVEQCMAESHLHPFTIINELTDKNDVKYIIDLTIRNFHQLDVLIINDGILKNDSIEESLLENYETVNTFLLYQLMELAVPHLIRTKGNIVNVSMVAGPFYPNCLTPCINKSIMNQVTRCVASKLVTQQVRVNAVNPGFVITVLDESGKKSDQKRKKFFNYGMSLYPDALRRAGDVLEVVKTIAFLASDDASFITGVTLPVDGGRHVTCPH